MGCTGELNDLIANTSFRIVIALQATTGFLAAVVGTIVMRKCSNLWFHVNCRILLITMLVLYITHSAFIAFLQTFHICRYLSISNPCEIVLSSVFCFSIRFPMLVCNTAFTMLQMAMVGERALALWKRNEYEHYKCGLGLTTSAICILSSLILTAWSMRRLDFTAPTVYCSVSTNETDEGITTLYFILCSLDMFSLFGIALLRVFNVAAMKRNYSDLQSSYQLRENSSVLRLILPLTVFNGFCHLAFSATRGVFLMFKAHFSYVAYRTVFTAAYIVPYFTVVSPILLWLAIKESKQTRMTELRLLGERPHNERELYFKAYSKMWNA